MGPLGAALLNALMFNEPEQLIPWSVQASKTEIGNLAVTVFVEASKGDALAKKLLADSAAARALGQRARAQVIRRYAWDARLAPLDAMLGLEEARAA